MELRALANALVVHYITGFWVSSHAGTTHPAWARRLQGQLLHLWRHARQEGSEGKGQIFSHCPILTRTSTCPLDQAKQADTFWSLCGIVNMFLYS